MEKRKLIKKTFCNQRSIDPFIIKIDKGLVAVLIMYIFMYQYVFGEIALILPVLGIGIILCGFYIIMIESNVLRKSSYFSILICIGVIEFFSITLSENGSIGNSTGINIIEYIAIGFAIYIFLALDENNFTFLLSVISITIAMLAVASYVFGTARNTGAIGIIGLNTNLMSSMFLMGTYSTVILMQRKCIFPKPLLYIFLVLIFISQVMNASRRGFIVLFVFMALYFIYAVYFVKNSSISIETFVISAVVSVLIVIGVLLAMSYIMSHTVLGQRLLGSFDRGDDMRTFFHTLAYQVFLEYPVFGIGINCFRDVNPYHMYTHSLYYELLVCTGIVGTISFAVSGIFISWRVLKNVGHRNCEVYNISKNKLAEARINLIFILCILLSGFAVVLWYDLYFYLCIAMITASCDFLQREIEVYQLNAYTEKTTGLVRRLVRVDEVIKNEQHK